MAQSEFPIISELAGISDIQDFRLKDVARRLGYEQPAEFYRGLIKEARLAIPLIGKVGEVEEEKARLKREAEEAKQWRIQSLYWQERLHRKEVENEELSKACRQLEGGLESCRDRIAGMIEPPENFWAFNRYIRQNLNSSLTPKGALKFLVDAWLASSNLELTQNFRDGNLQVRPTKYELENQKLKAEIENLNKKIDPLLAIEKQYHQMKPDYETLRQILSGMVPYIFGKGNESRKISCETLPGGNVVYTLNILEAEKPYAIRITRNSTNHLSCQTAEAENYIKIHKSV